MLKSSLKLFYGLALYSLSSWSMLNNERGLQIFMINCKTLTVGAANTYSIWFVLMLIDQ